VATLALIAACGVLEWPHAQAQQAVAPAEGEPLYAVSTRLDRSGRVLAPVMVNGQGPFRFILDTGANRSVIGASLAEKLQLPPSERSLVAVHGVTGSGVLPAVRVRQIQAGSLEVGRNKDIPVLAQPVLGGADGILGIEGLGSARIDIDFEKDRVEIKRSTGRDRAEPGFLTIPASLKHRGLLMIPARVGRVTVKAIIDTGAERTLGNAALRDALLLSPKVGEEPVITTVLGATPDLGRGVALIVPTIYIGDAELSNLEVTFADLHVFRLWGLEKEPAILIGMDLLGVVQRLVVDYRRREVQLLPREKLRLAPP
jgi:predicted aspartyl protease